jgi:hypothetical protein
MRRLWGRATRGIAGLACWGSAARLPGLWVPACQTPLPVRGMLNNAVGCGWRLCCPGSPILRTHVESLSLVLYAATPAGSIVMLGLGLSLPSCCCCCCCLLPLNDMAKWQRVAADTLLV